jgi:hypothetical protein
MTPIKKGMTGIAAAATIAVAAIAVPSDAQARRGWVPGAVIGGLAAGAIIGGALARRTTMTTGLAPLTAITTAVRAAMCGGYGPIGVRAENGSVTDLI